MDTQVNPPLTAHDERSSASSTTGVKERTRSPDAGVIQLALNQILASAFFCKSQQTQNLLCYIVQHSLAGEDHLLRERVIGSEVFGRRPDYEPGEDPVVRLRVSELRKRLAQYYHSVAENPQIHIEIPAGSYKAVFLRKNETQPISRTADSADLTLEPASPPLLPESSPLEPEHNEIVKSFPDVPSPSSRSRGTRIYAAIAAVGILIAGGIVYAPFYSVQTRRFHAFWEPWVNARKPVIIAIGSNAVYRLSDSLADKYASTHGLEPHGEEFFVPFAATDTIHGSDLVPADSSFVALGDVAAISHLVANITQRKQGYQERFPNDISFAELRNSPSILVGGFNNPMTIELTKKLRFILRARNEIDDTQDPTRRWVLNASLDSHDTEDYAIVTRIAASTDAPMLSVAGMGQYGTLAAADFICSPAAISDLARKLPGHWQDRNLQILLHVKVVDFKVASTDVVTVHTW